jgi:hypothetical protein
MYGDNYLAVTYLVYAYILEAMAAFDAAIPAALAAIAALEAAILADLAAVAARAADEPRAAEAARDAALEAILAAILAWEAAAAAPRAAAFFIVLRAMRLRRIFIERRR